MALSLRLSDQDTALIKSYAKMKKISVSELLRQAVLEKIEEEYDLHAYEKALAQYHENPVTYTLDEIENELIFK